SSDELKELVKFWVGWEAPSSTLTVEGIYGCPQCCLLLMAQQMACLRNSDPMVWIIRQATVLPVKMREEHELIETQPVIRTKKTNKTRKDKMRHILDFIPFTHLIWMEN
ncbi:hypothetical protein KUCAC02_014283, partial [Chaenocephalus aceratus]